MARAVAGALLVLALAGCGGGKGSPSTPVSLWPAPPNPMELAQRARLKPERAEFLQYHVHAHLDVFVNGKPVRVPSGIGIDSNNPAVQGDPNSGYGLSRICGKPCISPLHTHGPDGVLHTETKTVKPNRLGQFFIEWNVRLEPNCVDGYCTPKTPIAIYIDGQKFTGDPRNIELSDGREIAIVIGTPPSSIPSVFPH
jgi:hypothetical protein